jgi:DNA-binding NarL/FixJ family response regulator
MIRIFIVDENYLICNVISTLLEKQSDLQVVGWSTPYQPEVINQAARSDVVLLDGKLPGRHKFGFIQLLGDVAPVVKVVVMGLNKSEKVILHHLEAGAAGYVLQDDSADNLLRAIRAAYRGESLVSPRMTTALIARVAQLKQLLVKQGVYTDLLPTLTEREREVLDLVKQGLANREIGERLVIEVGTVKNHIHNILRKFKVNSRRDIPFMLELIDNDRLMLELSELRQYEIQPIHPRRHGNKLEKIWQ